MVPLPSSAMRAAAAAAGVRRAARCVCTRTAASRGDSARPSTVRVSVSSIARHERAPIALGVFVVPELRVSSPELDRA